MTRLDNWVCAMTLAIVAIIFPLRLWWDLNNPENWDREPWTDPPIYVPVWIATCFLVLGIAGRIAYLERIRKRRARLAAILIRAEELIRQHRHEDASIVLEECRILFDKVRST